MSASSLSIASGDWNLLTRTQQERVMLLRDDMADSLVELRETFYEDYPDIKIDFSVEVEPHVRPNQSSSLSKTDIKRIADAVIKRIQDNDRSLSGLDS